MILKFPSAVVHLHSRHFAVPSFHFTRRRAVVNFDHWERIAVIKQIMPMYGSAFPRNVQRRQPSRPHNEIFEHRGEFVQSGMSAFVSLAMEATLIGIGQALIGNGQGEAIIVHALLHEVVELVLAFGYQKSAEKLAALPPPITIAVIELLYRGCQTCWINLVPEARKAGDNLVNGLKGHDSIKLLSRDEFVIVVEKAKFKRIVEAFGHTLFGLGVWLHRGAGNSTVRVRVVVLAISLLSSILDHLDSPRIVNNELVVARDWVHVGHFE